jgi:hypothetical protein
LAWPEDPFQPSNPSPTSVRSDRPRLIAPAYKWAALPTLIANDPYLKTWNDTIFGNATAYYSLPPVVYFMDGSSGILDNAREVKMRIKAFAYAYRMSNDSSWLDRAWVELQVRPADDAMAFTPVDVFTFRTQQVMAPLPSDPLTIDGILAISSTQQNSPLRSLSRMTGYMMLGQPIREARFCPP